MKLDSDRMKGLRRKENGQFSSFIPFGTQGEYVDMYSGLSLEQELLLGSQHSVAITKNSDAKTTINDYYIDAQGIKLYEVETVIEKKADPSRTEIISSLYIISQISGQDTRDKLIKQKITTINNTGSEITQRYRNN